jgi:hypothetical protein
MVEDDEWTDVRKHPVILHYSIFIVSSPEAAQGTFYGWAKWLVVSPHHPLERTLNAKWLAGCPRLMVGGVLVLSFELQKFPQRVR